MKENHWNFVNVIEGYEDKINFTNRPNQLGGNRRKHAVADLLIYLKWT